MFAVLAAARELKVKESCDFMGELVRVAAVPSQSKEYGDGLLKFYRTIANEAVPEQKVTASAKRPAVSYAEGAALIGNALKIKKRLMGYG